MSIRSGSRFLLAHVPRGLAGGWQILGITLMLLLGVELGCAAIMRHRSEPPLRVRMLDARLAAQGNPSGLREEHNAQEASHLEFEEFAYWRRNAQQTTTLNIDARGLRRTYNATAGGSEVIKIFVFGGSTVWGWNSRDDFTIPSQLSKLASAQGFRVQVVNYAQTGYVSTQEAVALLHALGAGERPNIAIMINGLNDVESTIFNSRGGLTFWADSRKWWFPRMFEGMNDADALTMLWHNSSTYQLLSHAEKSEPEVEDYLVNTLAREIAGHYAASVAAEEGLANGFNFRPFFYLQPVLFMKKKLTTEERALIPLASNHFLLEGNRRLFLEAYKQIGVAMKSNPRFKSIEGLFANTEELVYTDGQHYAETANEAIAKAIFEDIRGSLQQVTEGAVAVKEAK